MEMLFEFDGRLLPAVKKHAGPPLGHANSKSFLDRWQNDPAAAGRPYIEDGRWMVDVVRSQREPGPFIRDRLGDVNLGKHLNEARERGPAVVRVGDAGGADRGAGLESAGPEPYLMLLSKYLDRRRSWER